VHDRERRPARCRPFADAQLPVLQLLLVLLGALAEVDRGDAQAGQRFGHLEQLHEAR
jgi:hypothetical protein